MSWNPTLDPTGPDSVTADRRSIQPRSAAATIWEYSPEIWYAATGTGECAATAARMSR